MNIAVTRINNEFLDIQNNPPAYWKVSHGSEWNKWVVWITADVLNLLSRICVPSTRNPSK
jgi:hypothetical protein